MKLRILLDQNVPKQVCHFLITERPEWTVQHVGDVGLWGAADATILSWAQSGDWIVLTFDEDFADARMFPVGSHAGVIRLRVWPTTIEQTEAALARLLRDVPESNLTGSLVIVDQERIRVRRHPRHG